LIDHVIAFKALRLGAQEEAELFDRLAELGTVPGVVGFALGRNEGDRSRGFDVCMRVTLESWEALQAYENHPVHKDVVAYNRKVTAEHICFDFEWPAA
jgi:hypothetical protein